MEESLKILQAEEKYEKQNTFCKPQIHLAKILQAQIHLMKNSQTQIHLANTLRKHLKGLRNCSALRKPKSLYNLISHTQKALQNLRGFANLFCNPNTQIHNLVIRLMVA